VKPAFAQKETAVHQDQWYISNLRERRPALGLDNPDIDILNINTRTPTGRST
jgi:hypothetical protein